MNENTGFSNNGMKTRLDPTVATYRFKAEGHVAVFIYEILKGLQNVCFGHSTSRGNIYLQGKTEKPARIQGIFLVCRRQVVDWFDRLIKIWYATTNFIPES